MHFPPFWAKGSHPLFDPTADPTDEVFEAMAADPLYRTLCRVQKSFRARLTPKPWRCNCVAPFARWPWTDAKSEESFKNWDGLYRESCEPFATCTLLAATGNPQLHPEIAPLVPLHDELTRAESKLPLT